MRKKGYKFFVEFNIFKKLINYWTEVMGRGSTKYVFTDFLLSPECYVFNFDSYISISSSNISLKYKVQL